MRALVGVVVAVASFFVARALRVALHDQQVFLSGGNGMRHWEAARVAFARGDSFPLWDRTECGGTPSLGDPESLVLSSLFAGVFRVHGDVMGRWYPTIGAALGIVGTYLWCRRSLSLGRVGSFFAGVVFVANGFLALQTALRMLYVPFFFIPWVLYLARVGEKDVRGAALAGLVLAAMVLEGGLFPFVLACIALLLVTAPRLLEREAGPLVAGRTLLIVGVAFALLAGVKLYPVAVQMVRWPGHVKPTESLKWTELMPMLVDKERFDGLAGHPFHYNEYRAYVGPWALGAAIAGAGVSVVLKPRRWGLALLLLGGLLLARGAYSPTAPYSLLVGVMPWNAFVVASRFVVLAALGIAAAGGVAFDAALNVIGSRRGLAVVVLAVAFVAAWDPIVEARKIMKAQGMEPWLPRPDPTPKGYFLVGEDLHRVAEFPARAVGSPACERLLDEPQATGLQVGERPQAWPEAPQEATVGAVTTSQNGYAFHVKASRPLAIHVNTSWDPDWTTNVGATKRAPNGMLDVVVPPGDSDVVLRYRPRAFAFGLFASVLGFVGLLLLLLRRQLLWLRRRFFVKNTTPPTAPTSPTAVSTMPSVSVLGR